MDVRKFLDDQRPQARILRGCVYVIWAATFIEVIATIILAYANRHDRTGWDHAFRFSTPIVWTGCIVALLVAIWGIAYIEFRKDP